MVSLEKQHLLLSNLISSNDLAAITCGIVKPEYFDSKYRQTATFILNYIEKYKDVPTEDIIKAETGITFSKKQLLRSEISYSAVEIEDFCRQKAIENVILYGANLLGDDRKNSDKKNFGELEVMLRDAISVGLQKELGIDYFRDPKQRLEKMLLSNKPIPTGLPSLDDIIGGGVNRQELLLFAANSGVGKSIFMANIAVNLLNMGFNVLYISLEMSDMLVSKRIDSMITGVPYSEILNDINKVSDIITLKGQSAGNLTIKRMPESITTCNDIRAYLKEFELVYGYIPEVIVVDYLDLMASNRNISIENMFIYYKFIAEELRAIAHDNDMISISACQLKPGALDTEEHHQGHIQGGISKVNTADNVLGIFQTEVMKAAGQYQVKGFKTRNANGVGKECILRWNGNTLRVTEMDTLNFKKKIKNPFEMPAANIVKNDQQDMLNTLGKFDNI